MVSENRNEKKPQQHTEHELKTEPVIAAPHSTGARLFVYKKHTADQTRPEQIAQIIWQDSNDNKISCNLQNRQNALNCRLSRRRMFIYLFRSSESKCVVESE